MIGSIRTGAAALLLLCGPCVFADAVASGTLTPGAPVERMLAGGETHLYRVPMTRGQFLHVAVEQRGIDVVVTSLDPAGREILVMDRPNGSRGFETLSIVAGEPGIYGLRIRSLYPDPAPGRYEITTNAARSATAGDRRRVAAEKALVVGQRLEATGGSRLRAFSLYKDAVSLFRSIGDRREEAVSLFLMAIARATLGAPVEALDLYRQAREVTEATGDQQLRARVLYRTGLLQASVGHPAEGMALLEEALTIARRLGDRETEIDTLNNMGYVAFLLARYQKALESYQSSLPLARAARLPVQEAWALFGFGFTYWALNEPEKSVRSYSDALRIWRARKSLAGEALSLQGLSAVYWSVGAAQKAFDAVAQTLPVVRALGDRPGEALALCNLGLAEAALGKRREALEHFRQAYSIWGPIGDPRMAWAIYDIADTLESLGEARAAGLAWQEALAVSRRLGNRTVEAANLAGLARSEGASEDLASARSHAEASLAIVEAIRSEVSSEWLRSSFLAAKQNAYAILVDIFLKLHDREPRGDYASLAFAASERGRVQSLLEAVTEVRLDLSRELPSDLQRRETELGQQIKQLHAKLASAGEGRGALEEQLSHAEEEWDGLVGEIRRRSPRYAFLTYPKPASVQKARELLDANTALVSYSVTASRSLVFLLTPDGLEVVALPISSADLAERVENYVGLIAAADSIRWQTLGSRLYADLVSPWRGRLPKKTRRLIVVPDGPLHSLPFETLPAPGKAGRYLLQDFGISYAPSATVLRELRGSVDPSARPAAARLLALANPPLPRALARSRGELEGARFDMTPLPYAEAEARAVSRFGGAGSELRTGLDASERFLLSAPLDRFRVIHFATHAFLNRDVPSRSALLLAAEQATPGSPAGDGLLRAREIYRFRLASDLVVLSACQTAQGRILPGEGVQGLAQAFFHAGAKTVVASLWNVSDRRTEELMKSFYGHLAEGQSKGEALRSAKLDLLRREPNLAPRYWAPFVLIGEPYGKVPLQRPSWWRRLFD